MNPPTLNYIKKDFMDNNDSKNSFKERDEFLENDNDDESSLRDDISEKIISITEKLKKQDSLLNGLRKDLNNNKRETIAFNAINKSKNKKALDKSPNFQQTFQHDLVMTKHDFKEQMRNEKSDYINLSKKFNYLYDDMDRIHKLLRNLEERIKVCEIDVGIHLK